METKLKKSLYTIFESPYPNLKKGRWNQFQIGINYNKMDFVHTSEYNFDAGMIIITVSWYYSGFVYKKNPGTVIALAGTCLTTHG